MRCLHLKRPSEAYLARLKIIRLLAFFAAILSAVPQSAYANDFPVFVQSLWPEAKSAGISRATFDKAFEGMSPDLKLPDLDFGGPPKADNSGQAEFTKTAADYISKNYMEKIEKQKRA